MIHRFIHTFQDGQKIDLRVDLSQNIPKIYCEPRDTIINKENYSEYYLWYDYYILPYMMDLFTPEQIKNLEEIGKKKLNNEFDKDL